ncbi:MAG: hypothetical protein WCH78_11610, partial [Bacteroidota bacterium]
DKSEEWKKKIKDKSEELRVKKNLKGNTITPAPRTRGLDKKKRPDYSWALFYYAELMTSS